jgi:hypothetical protein
MRNHAIVVEVMTGGGVSADLINEYLRIFRRSREWERMREDLRILDDWRGSHYALVVGPDPMRRTFPRNFPGLGGILHWCWVSKAVLYRTPEEGGETWTPSSEIPTR